MKRIEFFRWHETVYAGAGPRERFAFVPWLGVRLRVGSFHYGVMWPGRCECRAIEHASDPRSTLPRTHGLSNGECGADAVRTVTVRGGNPSESKQVPMCEACSAWHEASVPISAPGSTVEDLYNDLAALDVASRAVAIIRQIGGETLSLLEANGAGVYDSRATLVWLAEKIAETENTIDALEGAGPPLGPVTSVTVCDVCNKMKPRDTVHLMVVAGSETWACDDCREAGQP